MFFFQMSGSMLILEGNALATYDEKTHKIPYNVSIPYFMSLDRMINF